MSENDDRERTGEDADVVDNHEWADRVAAGRQNALERIGLIAVAVIAVLGIVSWLW